MWSARSPDWWVSEERWAELSFGEVVGYLLDHGFGYGAVFGIAGTLHVAAFLIILTAVPVLLPLKLERKLNYQGVA